MRAASFVSGFLCFTLLSVLLFTASGPLVAVMPSPIARKLAQTTHTFHANVPPQPPFPPPLPPYPPPAKSAPSYRSVDATGAVDPGGQPRVGESSPLIQAMIEAGFSRAQAIKALEATGAKSSADVPKAIEWSLAQAKDKNRAEFEAAREVHWFEKMDFDGYAVVWGDKNRARTVGECGKKCLEWKPLPPSNFPCNVFVFCPTPKCYAPAQLPPGSMTGQCWLKHQEDPNHPQVNMRGDYSEAYIKRHPGAPPSVQWQAGVVVRNGTKVDLSTWSSRANW
jgi:hypothetical protein